MAWSVVQIDSLKAFHAIGTEFVHATSAYRTTTIFRGQSKADWALRSSLHRELRKNTPLEAVREIEKLLMRDFRKHAHHHLPDVGIGTADVDWVVRMQEYGAPTRLLDWTHSYFVAAYFAVRDHWHLPGAIWSLHWPLVQKAMVDSGLSEEEVIRAPHDSWFDGEQMILRLIHARLASQRSLAQQGGLMLAQNPLATHEDLIDHWLAKEGQQYYRKLVIPAELKRPILKSLVTMNISAAALFPDIGGLGETSREKIRLIVGEMAPAASTPNAPA